MLAPFSERKGGVRSTPDSPNSFRQAKLSVMSAQTRNMHLPDTPVHSSGADVVLSTVEVVPDLKVGAWLS
jgi:hypothetical protein